MGATGSFGFIVPMPLLGDDQAAGVRRLLLDETGLIAVEAFPRKDDPRRRVFPEGKLSTTIFIVQVAHTDQPFVVRRAERSILPRRPSGSARRTSASLSRKTEPFHRVRSETGTLR